MGAYVPIVPHRRTTLALGSICCLVAVAGCGGTPARRVDDGTPAVRPSGASAQVVRYHCQAGRRGEITVSLPDPRGLAEVVNPIAVCEVDSGLADVDVALRCSPNAPSREVHIVAVQGNLPASAARTACG